MANLPKHRFKIQFLSMDEWIDSIEFIGVYTEKQARSIIKMEMRRNPTMQYRIIEVVGTNKTQFQFQYNEVPEDESKVTLTPLFEVPKGPYQVKARSLDGNEYIIGIIVFDKQKAIHQFRPAISNSFQYGKNTLTSIAKLMYDLDHPKGGTDV